MRTQSRYIFSALVVALLLVLTGCSVPGLASSPPTASQVLQNSIVAMSHLQSAHIDLQTNLNLPFGISATSTTANTSSLNVTGHGDVVNPDKVSLDLSMGNTPMLSVIGIDSKVYIREKSGNWFFLDKNQIKGNEQHIFTQSPTQSMGQIMTLLQTAKLTDHGQEVLNGANLEHITATLDGQALQQLSKQFASYLPSHGVQQLQQVTLDLWTDESTWYVHQAQLNLMANVQMPSSGSQNASSTTSQPVSVKLLLDFSKFNESVNIQAPANATALP